MDAGGVEGTDLARLKFWYGMGAAAWLRLLSRHEFAIDRSRLGIAAIATLLSIRNSAMGMVQSALRGVSPGPPLPPDPIIILGHWRCGTTLLHELLAADPRHTAPTTYACLAPAHFRVTEPVAMRWLGGVLPSLHRPMDRMPIHWHSPQEDDLAMLALGCASVYDRIAFPRCGRGATVDPWPVDPRWRRLLSVWLRDVLAQRPGRPVLKSPLHMARIPALLELFPQAVFVHIVRDPYVVFPSTVHMWASLAREHGLQPPPDDDRHEFVFETFARLHADFEQHRRLIPEDRLVQVRYEDLTRHPRHTVAAIYQRLRLGGCDPARSAVDSYLAGTRGYEPNRYRLPPAIEEEIGARWGDIIERQGYAAREAMRELHAC